MAKKFIDTEGYKKLVELLGKDIKGNSAAGAVFDTIVTSSIASVQLGSLADENVAAVVFHSQTKRFLAKSSDGKYYSNWGTDRGGYGPMLADGVAPIKNKLYYCKSEKCWYYWTGTAMAAAETAYSKLSGKPVIPGIATKNAAGIVKPGTGINVAADGTISVSEVQAVTTAEIEESFQRILSTI